MKNGGWSIIIIIKYGDKKIIEQEYMKLLYIPIYKDTYCSFFFAPSWYHVGRRTSHIYLFIKTARVTKNNYLLFFAEVVSCAFY